MLCGDQRSVNEAVQPDCTSCVSVQLLEQHDGCKVEKKGTAVNSLTHIGLCFIQDIQVTFFKESRFDF